MPLLPGAPDEADPLAALQRLGGSRPAEARENHRLRVMLTVMGVTVVLPRG